MKEHGQKSCSAKRVGPLRSLQRWARYGLAFVLLTVPMGAAAQPAPAGTDFRADLQTMVRQLAAVPGASPETMAQLEQGLAALGPEELAALESRFTTLRNWQAWPEVLSSLAELREERLERLRRRLEAGGTLPASKTSAGIDSSGPTSPFELPPDPERYPGMVQSEQELAEMEAFREDFLFFVAGLGAYSPLTEDPALFELRVARILEHIEEIPAAFLPKLRAMYYRHAPGWNSKLSGQGHAGRGPGKDLFPTIPTISCDFGCPCDFDCCGRVCVPLVGCTRICEPICSGLEDLCNLACDGIDAICGELNGLIGDVNSLVNDINSFFDDATAFFEDIFADIVGLIDNIEGFFTGLWDTIESLFESLWESLLSAVPTSLEDALSFTGVDVLLSRATEDETEDYWLAAADAFLQGFTLSVECDLIGLSQGADLGLFGVVGTARSEWICNRGLDWIDETIWETVPKDWKAAAIYIPYGLVFHFPIEFFCKCLEVQSGLSFDLAQADHRDLQERLLDADVDTRATDAGMETLRSSLDQLTDTDLPQVSAGVAKADNAVVDLDSDVAAVGSLMSQISASQSGQDDQIVEFQTRTLRLRIEENLLQLAPEDAVALFQNPSTFAGFLQTVQSIVTETVAMTAAAGQDTFQAASWLQLGNQRLREQAYEKAYESFQNAYREAVREQ